LRWNLFKKTQAEAEKLPPTADALYHHTLRAHYRAMIWHHDDEACPHLPSPTMYDWKLGPNSYIPIITELKPAPEAIIELVRCGCQKNKCSNARCSCRRASLVCTEMCSCEGANESCENIDVRMNVYSDDEDGDEDN